MQDQQDDKAFNLMSIEGADLVCHCRQVRRDRLELALNFGILDLQQVVTRTLAGSGCGSCRSTIKKMIKDKIKS